MFQYLLIHFGYCQPLNQSGVCQFTKPPGVHFLYFIILSTHLIGISEWHSSNKMLLDWDLTNTRLSLGWWPCPSLLNCKNEYLVLTLSERNRSLGSSRLYRLSLSQAQKPTIREMSRSRYALHSASLSFLYFHNIPDTQTGQIALRSGTKLKAYPGPRQWRESRPATHQSRHSSRFHRLGVPQAQNAQESMMSAHSCAPHTTSFFSITYRKSKRLNRTLERNYTAYRGPQ